MTQDITSEAEATVKGIVEGLRAERDQIEKDIPRPFGHKERPFEERLQELHKTFNPLVLGAYRKVYGRRMLVRELLESDLLKTYLERVRAGSGAAQEQQRAVQAQQEIETWGGQNGAQETDAVGFARPAAAVAAQGREPGLDGGGGGEAV